MKVEDFSKFVADQQETVDEAKSWAEVRDEWLKELDALYDRIEDYLQDYIKAGSISCRFTEVELNEEKIGPYLAKKMDIKIGRQHAYLEPLGTLLIGFKGRVDVVGSAGRGQLVLVNSNVRQAADLFVVRWGVEGALPPPPGPPKQPISWAWKILTNTSPPRFVDLDREQFLELLMEIANA
jgi:hypothetical protein